MTASIAMEATLRVIVGFVGCRVIAAQYQLIDGDEMEC
jgi:hypothetical protein